MRTNKIHNSVGMNDAYKYFRNNSSISNKISESMYRRVIRKINKYIQEELSRCRDFNIPYGLGHIEVRKVDVSLRFEEGKLINNKPIDWKTTNELWNRNPIAKEKKKLVRFDVDYLYLIKYIKSKARYMNQQFFEFSPNRFLKIKLKNNINDGSVDAFALPPIK